MTKFLICFVFLVTSFSLASAEEDYTGKTYDYEDSGGPLKHLDFNDNWVDVTGSDMEGDYVHGEVELGPGSTGEGRVFDEEGNEENIEVDSGDQESIEAHDEGGVPYQLDED